MPQTHTGDIVESPLKLGGAALGIVGFIAPIIRPADWMHRLHMTSVSNRSCRFDCIRPESAQSKIRVVFQ